MTDAPQLETALNVGARNRRAILNLRHNHECWAIAGYLDLEVPEVQAVISCADSGTLRCPSEEDILAEESLAHWVVGAATHEGAAPAEPASLNS